MKPKVRTTVYLDAQLHERLKARNTSKLVNELLRQHFLYLRVAKLEEFTEIKCYRCKETFQIKDLKQVLFISGLVKRLCFSCFRKEKAKGPYCTIKEELKV